jgi:hypothetical protein
VQFFQDLGRQIESRWRAASYSEQAFPEIAARALSETDPQAHVSHLEIVRWVLAESALPHQADLLASFGDPPITLHHGSRFHVDAYFWVDGTTDIHQHGFSGAFQVLAGSSLHGRYRFACRKRINEHFLAGALSLEAAEHLRPGDVRPILPGPEGIHSLFHLERPSVTIVVRTPETPSAQPQFSYLPPSLAWDPHHHDPRTTRIVQAVSLLLRAGVPEAPGLIRDVVADADLETAYRVIELVSLSGARKDLSGVFDFPGREPLVAELLDLARARHGELAAPFAPVLAELRRASEIFDRRRLITSAEHRFFLALVLNFRRRAAILDMVGARFPDRDPVETILGWVRDLAATREMGSAEANVLASPDLDEDALHVLGCLIRGESGDAIARSLARRYPADEAALLVDGLDGMRLSLERSWLLGPMLTEPEA